MDKLKELAETAKKRIEEEKQNVPKEDLLWEIRQKKVQMILNPLAQSETAKTPHSFYQALKKPGMSCIRETSCAETAAKYKEAGVAAVSCWTEPVCHGGTDQDLWEIASEVDIPVLRKDMIVDDYMIIQAAAYGAAAVLLICELLDDGQLREYRELAEELGMDALLEVHNEEEISRASDSGARILSISGMNAEQTAVLRRKIPADTIVVAECCDLTGEDVEKLCEAHVDAVMQ